MRSAIRPLAALVAVQLLAGVLIGLIWLWWSPRTVAYLVPISSTGSATVVIPDESEAQIAGDGRFFLLCLIVGLLAGLLAWLLLPRRRGPATLITLAVSGLASSLVAFAVGHGFSSATKHPAVQTAYHPALSLHSPIFLAVQTLFAAVVYCVFAGLSSDPAFVGPRDGGADRTEAPPGPAASLPA
ncbi:MAG: hypothetical protein JWO63_2830 [Frankiales bacterium]|nr:hypothetical protein [Frankiales bacterium]